VSERVSSALQDRDGDDDVRLEEIETTNTTEDTTDQQTSGTSFRHLWTDYNVDWKDTRRYHHHSDASAGSVSQHRKLCMYISQSLPYLV